MPLTIRRNFPLRLLALGLAILGWAYFRFANNPFTSARFTQALSVPITAANLTPGYFARYADKTAVVTIQPKRGDPPVRADELKAVIDLSNRTTGVYNVPVQLVAPPIVVQSLSPATITLTVTKIDQKTLPLAMHYGGQANVVVSAFTVTPATASVRGPVDELSQVVTLRVDLPLETNTSRFDEMIRPIAAGSSGQEIPDVQVVPNLVRVRARFLPAAGASSSPSMGPQS